MEEDVKIFSAKKAKAEKIQTVNNNIDELSLIKEMDSERSNGNLAKAKNLGLNLANIFIDEKSINEGLQELIGTLETNKEILFQIRILMVFGAEKEIGRLLKKALLCSTAINALHDKIHDDNLNFYNEFSDGAEYSFYYLALKSSGDIVKSIGRSFAMLCGRENDFRYKELGEKLWIKTITEVDEIIGSYKFK
ncbi:MAG: hypothetical protein ACTTIO_00195 [Candidatus Fimenecus sp.]